ncbi:unnamed protein product [Sphacelaria rigidula]
MIQGFRNELNAETNKAALVASLGSIRAIITDAVRNGFSSQMLNVRTAFLQARVGENDPTMYLIPSKGFQGSKAERDKWHTINSIKFLLKLGFLSSSAYPCACSLDNGNDALLICIDIIQMTGSDKVKIEGILYKLKSRFQTVDLGYPIFSLVIHIIRDDNNAESVTLKQETYAKSVLKTYGMSDERP